MPWIFLTLMLANVVYFGWNFMQAGQTESRPAAAMMAQEGARVLLLSERPAPLVAAVAGGDGVVVAETTEVEPTPVPEVIGVKGAPQCYTVGPFTSSSMLMRFTERMKEKRFSLRVDERKVAAKDYWVYMPAFTNRVKADEKLRELRSMGVESFVVTEGSYINAISLGHFSRKELAQSFRDKMAASGLVVEYREVVESQVSKWVFLSPSRSKSNLRAVIDEELQRDKGLRREAAACEE